MLQRAKLLLGAPAIERLGQARVIIFGVGGVGSWCAECLIRSGVQHLTMVDSDVYCLSNCNRQLMATSQTIGQPKVDTMRQRLHSINPEADITALQRRYTPETADDFGLDGYDVVIDAIDSLPDKADLLLRVTRLANRPLLVSSMGAALRRDPFKVRQAEFWRVQGDALARALRNKFKRSGEFPAHKFQCVYSEEPPLPRQPEAEANGSLCHVTSIFGMSIAGIVINTLSEQD